MNMEAYDELYALVQRAGLLVTVEELLNWDQEVMMPKKAAWLRARQNAVIAGLGHELFTSKRIGELLAIIDPATLNQEQQAFVREVNRSYERAIKVPQQLVEDLAHHIADSLESWKEARKNDDFQAFAPYLEKMVELKKAYAKAIDPAKPAYEVILQDFEPDLSIAEIRSFLTELKEGLLPILKQIPQTKRQGFIDEPVPVPVQETFLHKLATALGYDFGKGRLDVSAHPFTGAYGRITTRFSDNWLFALMGTVHETGHALYEHGLPEKHVGTPLGTASTMGVHESQSRFWENMIARSKPFWEWCYPKIKEQYPPVENVSFDELFAAVNHVAPGYIRVDADEVTYAMHIILRFEIEDALLSGELLVADLPRAWNEKMKAYLGIDVPNNAQGCLQDTHWSQGLFGYFPSYAIGSALAAQLFAAMQQDLPADDLIRKGDFKPILDWLHEKIHKHGQLFAFQDLVREATGKEFSPADFIAYIKEKYEE